MDVITINTDCQEEYETKSEIILEYGYELKSCSCGYYCIASDTCFPYWMAILVKNNNEGRDKILWIGENGDII